MVQMVTLLLNALQLLLAYRALYQTWVLHQMSRRLFASPLSPKLIGIGAATSSSVVIGGSSSRGVFVE